MAAPASTIPSPVEVTSRPRGSKRFRPMGIALLVIGAIVLFYAIILTLNWPFTKQGLIDVLQEGTLRTVTIQRFHSTVFPPGATAEGIAFEHLKHKEKAPIMFIPKLTITANWGALLTFQHRLSSVTADGMHITVPPSSSGGFQPLMPLNHSEHRGPSISISTVVANRADVHFMRPGKQDLAIRVNKLVLHNIGRNSAIPYEADVYNTEPPGDIRSQGVFGPWDPNSPAGTQLKGAFSYQDANLAYYRIISGTVAAHGRFSGSLRDVRISGDAEVPHFKLSDTSHDRDLKTKFDVTLNGLQGNAVLHSIDAQFDRTALHLTGSIEEAGNAGKQISVRIPSGQGRIEDLIDLFISGPKSPITGNITFGAQIVVPPGPDKFVRRMNLQGWFGISGGRFSNKETDSDLTRLSKSATKQAAEDPATVLSDLRAKVTARNGVAHLTNVFFSMPGAHANLDGTYNLVNYRSNFYGVLVTDGDVSKSTSGVRAFLMKCLTPFLKRKRGDKIVGFHLSGPYGKLGVMFDPDAAAQIAKAPSQRD